jgi:hypothetical protein
MREKIPEDLQIKLIVQQEQYHPTGGLQGETAAGKRQDG